MTEYLVIGLYADNHQRFADTYRARTAEGAERQALAAAHERGEGDLIVAGVLHRGVVVA